MKLVPAGAGRVEVVSPRITMPGPSGPYPPEATIPAPGGRVHRVAPGDSLQNISRRYYGSPAASGRLHAANRALIGPDPTSIFPGQVLSVPY